MERIYFGECQEMENLGNLIFIGHAHLDHKLPNPKIYECDNCHKRYREGEFEDNRCPKCNHEEYLSFLEDQEINGNL